MTAARPQPQRRSEVRSRAPATRIAWARSEETKLKPGWISSVAPSSIAFVTPTRDQPSTGDVIELTFEPGSQSPQRRWVRVARTDSYDRFFSIVGCRNEPEDEILQLA